MAKKAIIGAGLAAATAAGIAAVVRKTNSEPRYHVKAVDGSWVVKAERGIGEESRHGTKREAVDAGRELATSKAPSELVIHRMDGTVQDTRRYED